VLNKHTEFALVFALLCWVVYNRTLPVRYVHYYTAISYKRFVKIEFVIDLDAS